MQYYPLVTIQTGGLGHCPTVAISAASVGHQLAANHSNQRHIVIIFNIFVVIFLLFVYIICGRRAFAFGAHLYGMCLISRGWASFVYTLVVLGSLLYLR
jgi:hypothetical protein